MSAFCIRPELAVQLKQAAKAGEISMQKLFEMGTEERNSLFAKYTDNETAKQINTGFEKAMASNQQQVLNNWVKRTFTAQDKKSGKYTDVISKINDLQKQGVLNPENEKAFLSDLVSSKLGATITADEAKQIDKRSIKLQELQKSVSGIGDPTANPEGQIAYMKAQEEMSKYLLSLNPSSQLRVFLGTIGRGAMVTSIHSPFLNVIAHTAISLPEMIGRRIEARSVQGMNTGFWMQYVNNANKIFDNTGYDISRWDTLGGERKTMGEGITHSEGSGAVRWTGRLVENTTFHYLHGILYQRFAALHFADSANLVSSSIARAEGLVGQAAKDRALEISKDAALIEPLTDQGKLVRAKAEADATYATFTNKSAVSDTALGLRKLADNVTGDLQIGQLVVPFAKVPANALAASLEYSGVNMTGKTLQGLVKTINGIAGGEGFDRANFAGTQRMFIRAGLGFTFAVAISQLIKPENFIGAYPTSPSEQKLLSEQNGVTNSIKVNTPFGLKWISLDYLAQNSATLLGLLYAKKYGNNTPADFMYQYSKGISQYLANTPGLAEGAQVYKYLTTPPSKKDTAGSASQTAGKYLLSQLSSRIIPGFISDIAKMTDQYNRTADKTSITQSVEANIPGLREGIPGINKGVPISKTMFNEPQKAEFFLSTMLFGSRVKTAQESTVLNELVRLDQVGELPSITDISKTSKAAGVLKQEIGQQKFDQAMQYYGKNLKQNFNDTITSDDYKTADSDTARKAMLDKVKLSTWKDTLDTFNYVKPEKP